MVAKEIDCHACKYYPDCYRIWGSNYHSDCPQDLAMKAEWKRLEEEDKKKFEEEKKKMSKFKRFLYWITGN